MSLNAKTFIFISSAVLVVSFSFISLSPAVEPAAAPVLPYPKATTSLVLSITVNTEPKGDFFVELDEGGQLFLTPQDLDTLKLNYAKDRTVLIRNERYVPLDAVLEVKHAFDENRLTLSFIGKTAAAEKTSVNIFSLDARPRNLYSPRELSAFLNYGLTYSYADPLGFQAFTASNKIGARAGDVFFVSDSLYTKTETSGDLVRLQSSATYERRGELQWVVLGDQFANSGELGSSVNMGGVGFSKVYKLDPYFITQPVFDLKGTTIFPTQAEVYLDGVLIGRQAIAPGSFDLKNIYSYSGAHTVELVLKDPFGNEQRISSPAYFSSLLLRKGLHEYSYNAGFLREKYGIASNDYGKPAFSAFHRYGVTNSLNIGARAEGGDGVYDGGVSTQYLAPSFGAFSFSLAASDSKGTKGAAGSFQHSYQLGSFSTNVLLRGFSRDYMTLGAPIVPAGGQIKYEASVGTGFLLMPAGSFSLGYSKSETRDGIDTRIASLNYSRSISKSTSFFATGSETRKLDATTRTFFVGLSFNFDRNLHGALQYNKTSGSDTVTAQIQKDVPVGDGIGYRAALSRTHADQANPSTSFNPFFQYNARYGIYYLDSTIQSSSGRTSETYNLSVAGSLVYVGGFYGLSRPVSDSFGVVQVGNVPNATVLNNGQIIGNTDASGFMVVPSLSSYNLNRITVDTKNIPIDYSISSVTTARSPSLWSGSCIGFDAEKIQAVTGRLFAARGAEREPVEFWEGTFRVGTERIPFLTGKGGEFYIENSLPLAKQEGGDPQSCRSVAERRARGGKAIRPGTYPASTDYQGRTCSFTISFPETGEVLTDLGEIVCGQPEEAPKPPVTAVPAKPAPAAPPVPAAEPAPSSAEDDPPRSIVVRLRADGSPARLTAKSGKAVSALVRFLARHPDSSIEIEGHADRHGSEEDAARLGRRAAEAVKDILIRSGVKAGRIRKVESLGRKKMICAEESAVCDGLNRRVVVRAAASLE